ncbi:MAG: hypothetical protein DRP71_04880 [Verrucomicrobia bacterium]|nr:MAG: hypothetical protein DRP71_04880 [Verrucomicrobiota bacterium]
MICFRKRFMISSVIDAGERLPDDLKAHLERCGSCRRYYGQQREVAEMLQRPVDEKIELPAGLNESIMRAIREESEPRAIRRDRRRRFSPWLAPAALASVALAAALVILLQDTRPDSSQVAESDPGSPEAGVTSVGSAPSDYIRTWSVAINQPLDNELDNVVADARSAVRFLAINFLPDDRTTESL